MADPSKTPQNYAVEIDVRCNKSVLQDAGITSLPVFGSLDDANRAASVLRKGIECHLDRIISPTNSEFYKKLPLHVWQAISNFCSLQADRIGPFYSLRYTDDLVPRRVYTSMLGRYWPDNDAMIPWQIRVVPTSHPVNSPGPSWITAGEKLVNSLIGISLQRLYNEKYPSALHRARNPDNNTVGTVRLVQPSFDSVRQMLMVNLITYVFTLGPYVDLSKAITKEKLNNSANWPTKPCLDTVISDTLLELERKKSIQEETRIERDSPKKSPSPWKTIRRMLSRKKSKSGQKIGQ
ncbi:hypothetical protein BZA77DRAFT_297326 [Pyronema omphalodes]|nr:hypothetical protein BZA77DRAFT_297326 [Pyronema omphalodes]